jgi:RNA polymerase sigma-54 factor
MSISQKLDLKQSQNLIMTPQLREAISLLQLPNVELAEYLEKELAQNPLLEKDERPLDDSGEAVDSSSHDSETTEREAQSSDTSQDDSADFDETNTYDYSDSGDQFSGVGAGGSSKFEDPDYALENRVTSEKSLRDHLVEQLHMKTADQRERMVGAMMIDYLDESGYLRQSYAELAQKIGCSEGRIEKLHHMMRDFDPTGIFALDLPDCLALQLKEKNRFDPAIEKLLKNLEKVAEGDLRGLSRVCRVDEDDVRDMIAEIRRLNPRPTSAFDHVVVQTAIPDVIMQPLPKHIGGGWKVSLNHETLPRVLVNHEYHAIISKNSANVKGKNKKDIQYLNDQLASANWLVRALDQRAQTILKVASEIVEQQDGFFLYGVEFLKPLTLKDIAEEIDMHESTVSRVTANKYIGTPRGLFELKYFFDSGVSGSGGTAHSAEAVKARIKALIDAEDVKKILSDDYLADQLKKEGIDIARRTVAKYREAMHIPSSVMRRKQKRNAAMGKD